MSPSTQFAKSTPKSRNQSTTRLTIFAGLETRLILAFLLTSTASLCYRLTVPKLSCNSSLPFMNCAGSIWTSKSKNLSFSFYACSNIPATNTSFSKSIRSLIPSFLVYLKNSKLKKFITMNNKMILLAKLPILADFLMKPESPKASIYKWKTPQQGSFFR